MFKKINWRYALGEIIIVIIGITIAFSLNSWAEKAKNRANRNTYLRSLSADLDNEIQHLETNIEKFQSKIADIRQIFPYLGGKQEGRDTISQKIFGLAELVYFHPHDVTYKTLINSGELGLIRDFDLKKVLEEHYSNHKIVQLDYERQNNIHERYFADFVVKEVSYTKMRQGDYSFIDKPLLSSIISSLYGTFDIAIKTSQDAIERAQGLKAVLQDHLNKR